MLRGTAAAGAAPVLLAAWDEHCSAARAEPLASVPGAAAVPRTKACPICKEAYGGVAVVPRLLVTCGHTFCAGCLDTMLEPLRMRNGGKKLQCPSCRVECRVQRGVAASLPKNFDSID